MKKNFELGNGVKKVVKRLVVASMMATLSVATLVGCSSTNTDKSATAGEGGTKKYKIGIVQPMDHPSLNQIRETIIAELDELGLSDQIEIECENANGDSTLLTTIMQNLIGDGVDLLVPIATSTAQVAAATTEEIPIVFSAVSNPIEAGLVTSFDETTGNITGVSNSIPIEDIFELAKELTPDVHTFGFVYNSSEVNSATGIEKAKAYCDANGITYKEVSITGTSDLQQAVSSLVGEVDAFFTPNDNTVAAAMSTYLEIATEAGIPIYVGADSMVNDGGFATVGIDYTVLGKQTAQMIQRIYEGATIADTPVEAISEYAKMINMNTADALEITIPEAIQEEFVLIK